MAFALGVLLASTGCTAGDPGSPGAPSPGTASSEGAGPPDVITTGLDVPWSLAFHNGSALVSERGSARILELASLEPASQEPDTGGSPREAGTISSVTGRGEGGLLGIAARDGFLYTYFTAGDGNRIERRELTGDAGSLALGPASLILDGIQAGPVHNGGRIGFGPDGMLYATTGDAGNRDSAQDRQSLNGKILRMTPDGGVPADNPFPGSLVYSYGHRNPQGIAWGPDGILYATEFGQNTWDELNVIEAGGNYGWPEVEGIAGKDGYIDPVQQWAPAVASPSGITVAGDSLFIANLRGERLREVPLDDLGSSSELLVGEYGRLRDVVTAPDGALWVLTNNTDGRGDPGPEDDRLLRFEPR